MSALAPWLQPQLQALLAQRGHAWLLQGASGLGQYPLALAMASAWLCEERTPAGACGHCASCQLILARSHPDLVVLMPETVMLDKGWPLSEKAQSEIDDKKRKPSREIRVDAMRDTVDFSQLTSGRGRGKAAGFAIRFHLAPGVEVSATADGAGALLRIAEGALWRFRAIGGEVGIEDSLWIDSRGRMQPTRQLVITGTSPPEGIEVTWILARSG